ncbi:hypothetical protein Tco_1348053 [Tanacetum coccineum]
MARDLWNACLAYGNVVDVYIPFKKSKAGRFHLHTNSVSGKVNPNIANDSSPAIVLDDSFLIERDFSCTLMGKIKDINSLSNLYVILGNEGFKKVKLSYLGGQWVLLDMDSTISKEMIANHVGICIKELKAWSPKFITEEEDNSSSDGESEGGNNENDIGSEQGNEYDHVSETNFAQGDDNEYRKDSNSSGKPITSEDPFGIYKILKRNKETSNVESANPQYPPGFTPDVVEENAMENSSGKISKPNTTDKVICDLGSKF